LRLTRARLQVEVRWMQRPGRQEGAEAKPRTTTKHRRNRVTRKSTAGKKKSLPNKHRRQSREHKKKKAKNTSGKNRGFPKELAWLVTAYERVKQLLVIVNIAVFMLFSVVLDLAALWSLFQWFTQELRR
jgi:hypothetical protein